MLMAKLRCMRRNKIVEGEIKDYVEKSKAQKLVMKNKVEEEKMVRIVQRGK